MGYLLKEALKTLCGVNQWTYAIFWKIGCQNPKLLIWEECYYENTRTSISESYFEPNNNGQLGNQAENRVHFLVTKMMMDNHVIVVGEGLVGRAVFTGSHQWILSLDYNQEAHPPEVLKEVVQQFSAGMLTIAVIPVIPHGVVQFASSIPIMENAAFVNDVRSLFLQLGCHPDILLSEIYASRETTPKIGIPVGKSVAGISSGRSTVITESCNYKGELDDKATCAGQISSAGQVPGILHSRAAMFPTSSTSSSLLMPNATLFEAEMAHLANAHHNHMSQLSNSLAKAEVIPANSEIWLKQPTCSYLPRSNFDVQPSVGSSSLGRSLSMMEEQSSAGRGLQEQFSSKLNVSTGLLNSSLGNNVGFISSSCHGFGAHPPSAESELYGIAMGCLDSVTNFGSLSNPNLLSTTNESGLLQAESEVKIANSSKTAVSATGGFENSTMNNLLKSSLASGYSCADNDVQRDLADVIDALDDDLYKAVSIPHSARVWTKSLSHSISDPVCKERQECGTLSVSTTDTMYGGTATQPCSGDDLFDILGIDFKNNFMNGSWNVSQGSGLESSITNLNKKKSAIVKGSVTAADLSVVNQGLSDNSMLPVGGKDHLLDAMISSFQDDNASCKTTVTNTSSSSVLNVSGTGGEVGTSGQIQAEMLGFAKSAGKSAVFGSSSFKPEACKDGLRSYSQGSSLYGSQISSWIDQGQDNKTTNSVSTGYSKKTDDTGKANRKRLKPGENPRPRPKDRQMIQDRVKELREIVPNGAKCSIDALLERTIKHMLFLQSVMKHADKLKQSGESKILSKEGGLLIKDNYDGGVTWAYEIGSQSMVCPIIVEDLNQPRQMLVEMLCEERGLFLEIADIIRGLGLTILKGVMEAQKDKIWARFAVEANRDVTRMEIFISLVRLLEQNIKNGGPATNGSDNTMMAQQFPLPGTSIPATGRPCGLQ